MVFLIHTLTDFLLLVNVHAYISTFLLFQLWQNNQLKRGSIDREHNMLYETKTELYAAYALTVVVCWLPVINLLALYFCLKELIQDIISASRSEIESYG